jgi:rRNA maturation endonuclease Nob1
MPTFKFCTKCDYSTEIQDYRFCENCGEELSANCPSCKKPFPSAPYKFCGMCGEAIRPTLEKF